MSFVRFSRLFLEPLLGDTNEGVIQESIEEVEVEYQKRKGNDQFRIREVEKSLSKKNHPYNHFFCGKTRGSGTSHQSRPFYCGSMEKAESIVHVTYINVSTLFSAAHGNAENFRVRDLIF